LREPEPLCGISAGPGCRPCRDVPHWKLAETILACAADRQESGGRLRESVTFFRSALKALAVLAAPSAVLLSAGRADAVLTYYIFNDSVTGNAAVATRGSLTLPAAYGPTSPDITGSCAGGSNGSLDFNGGSEINICMGSTGVLFNSFDISLVSAASYTNTLGPIGGTGPASLLTALIQGSLAFFIDSTYTPGAPIDTQINFIGSLSSNGFSSPTTGVISTFNILDGFGSPTGEQIVVRFNESPSGPPVPPPSSAAVPGPLPLLGAAAAFGMSRKLRQRMISLR